jgi:uncharacterized membrane protein (DUF4010 family)
LAAHGTISVQVAGIGVVLNSLASTAVKLPIVARISGADASRCASAWR